MTPIPCLRQRRLGSSSAGRAMASRVSVQRTFCLQQSNGPRGAPSIPRSRAFETFFACAASLTRAEASKDPAHERGTWLSGTTVSPLLEGNVAHGIRPIFIPAMACQAGDVAHAGSVPGRGWGVESASDSSFATSRTPSLRVFLSAGPRDVI